MFCLVDGNNFYVSCERVFNPSFHNKPVVVLSNNDGCVVSRSNEAKAIGIKMGQPYFKCKQVLTYHNAIVCSSNYTLYADISTRIVEILKTFTPDVEVYSIDESFLYFSGNMKAITQLGLSIKQSIFKKTGIPVGVGFGKSKTLAKIANHMAKKITTGVVNIHDYDENKVLKTISSNQLWGVGNGFSTRLRQKNIHNALQIKKTTLKLLKACCHVHGERLKLELMGISAIPLKLTPDPNKSILSSKSFGKKINNIDQLKGALAQNIARAAEKLRKQQLKAKHIHVFLHTNRFKYNHYKYEANIQLPVYSSATSYLTHWAIKALNHCYIPNSEYTKSGVLLTNLSSKHSIQSSLLAYKDELKQSNLDKIMAAYDTINHKWGKQTISIASIHQKQKNWLMKQNKLTKKSTTKWTEIPIINV